MEDNKIEKVVKLKRNSDAAKFMETIKIPRNRLWYIIVEKELNKQEELHMIKYNQEEGVHANQFLSELKKFYIDKFQDHKNIKTIIENMHVIGNDNFSIIKNIPNVEIGGKKLISRMCEDLIKLLK